MTTTTTTKDTAAEKWKRSYKAKLQRLFDRAEAATAEAEPKVPAAKTKVQRLEAQVAKLQAELEQARKALAAAEGSTHDAGVLWAELVDRARYYPDIAGTIFEVEPGEFDEPPDLAEYVIPWVRPKLFKESDNDRHREVEGLRRTIVNPSSMFPAYGPRPVPEIAQWFIDREVPAGLIVEACRRRRAWLQEHDDSKEAGEEVVQLGQALALLATWNE